MRAHRVAIAGLVVGSVAGAGVACNSLLGIQGPTARPAVTQLSAGASFACALLADGTVWCWGADDHQQLGHLALDADVPCAWGPADGGSLGLCNPVPTQVAGLSNVTQIAVGSDFACALLGTGQVECWGNDDQGQLGPLATGDFAYTGCPRAFFDGGTTGSASQCTPVPKTVDGIPPATAIAAGAVHACASTKKGVYCWGDGALNLLDYATAGPGPVKTVHVPPAIALAAPLSDPPSAYADNTCALISADTTICWGPNSGYDDGCPDAGGVCKLKTHDVAAIHVGLEYGCTLGTTGTLDCWGQNGAYTFESSNPGLQATTPTASDYTQVLEETDKVTPMLVDGRSTHVLALDQAGGLWGWGDNTFGQLGAEPSFVAATCGPVRACVNVPAPVTWPDAGLVRGMATGVGFSLALTSDGTVWAWGANTEGQLGFVSDGGACPRAEGGPVAPCQWAPTAIQVPP